MNNERRRSRRFIDIKVGGQIVKCYRNNIFDQDKDHCIASKNSLETLIDVCNDKNNGYMTDNMRNDIKQFVSNQIKYCNNIISAYDKYNSSNKALSEVTGLSKDDTFTSFNEVVGYNSDAISHVLSMKDDPEYWSKITDFAKSCDIEKKSDENLNKKLNDRISMANNISVSSDRSSVFDNSVQK